MAFTLIQTDTFNRANVSPSSTPGGISNNWTDTAGNVFSISVNQLQGSTSNSNGFLNQFLTRPSSEAHRDLRTVVAFPANGLSNQVGSSVISAVVRYDSGTSNNYGAILVASSSTLIIYKLVAGVKTQLSSTALSTSFNTTHAYQIDLSATGVTPTSVVATVTDTTSAAVVATSTISDSEATLQISTGVSAVSCWQVSGGAVTAYVSSVSTYYATPIATALTVIGPNNGTVLVASTPFTVSVNGTLATSQTVALTDASTGVFSPTSLTLTPATTSATFTYTPPSTPATLTLSVSSSGLATVTSPYTSSAAATGGGASNGTIPTTPIVNYGAGPFTTGTTPATFVPQFGAGDALAARGIAQIKVFTDWLAAGGQQGKGIVTEVAIPSSSAQFTDPNNNALFNPLWDNVLQQWYEYCNRLSVSVTPWVTSEWNIDLRGYETSDGSTGPITYRSTATSVMENNLSNTVYQRGVAYGGGDYADSGASGGVNRGHLSQPGAAYYYPNPRSFPVLASRGMGCIRVPVRWERFQPTLKQALDPVEMAAFLPTLQAASAAGVKIFLDIHNYGRYDTTPTGVNTNGVLRLGDNAPAAVGGTMIDAYVDFMTRLATYFKANGGIYGYDIMNEPNALPNGNLDWISASQRAVEAIRLVDQNCYIAIEGYDYANARGWNVSNPSSPWMTQTIPAGQIGAGTARNTDPKIMWNAHHYFNYIGLYGQYDGTFTGTYANELSQAQSQGYAAWSTAGYTAPATNNTQQTGLRTTFKSDFSVDQGTYVSYVSSASPGNPNGITAGSNTITAPFGGTGNPAPSMKIVCSTTSDEGSFRQSLTGGRISRIASFDFQVDTSSTSLMSTLSTFNILHCWADTNTVDFVEVRINGSGSGYTTQIAIPGAGGAVANGTTVLPVGSFQNIKLLVTDTNFQLFLNGSATPEITLASVNTTKNIGGFAMGKFYGAAPLTMYYDNALFGTNATYFAPPNGGLLPALASGPAVTPPVVTLSANQTSGAAPLSLTLTAAVTVGSAAVASVSFYQSGSLIGRATMAPYTLPVANLAQGSYGFITVATDTNGNTGTSNTLTVSVSPAGGGGTVSVPSVSLSLSQASAVTPASVTLTGIPSTTLGYVTLVEFFSSGTKIGQATATPWVFTQTALPTGSYLYSAKVTDNSGNTALSTSQSFVVTAAGSGSTTPPSITLLVAVTNPVAPAAVTLNATAMGNGGASVASVSFYQNGTLLISQTASPFTYGVAGLAAGTYSFTATVNDSNSSQVSTPSQILIITPVTIITVGGGTGGSVVTSTQEITQNTQGTLLDIKQYVGHQWGRNDGNVPDPTRDSLVNDARHAYYASRRWGFLLRNGFVFQLSADTLYPTLFSAPLPANRNRSFDLAAVYDSLGRPITKHTVDQLLLNANFPISQANYAIDERRSLILTSSRLSSIMADYWMLPLAAKLDGSEDLLIEPATNLTAIKYLAMSFNWESGERDDTNFNIWQGLYQKQYDLDVKMDAFNQPIRQYRLASRNSGYSRRGGQAPPSGYVSRYY